LEGVEELNLPEFPQNRAGLGLVSPGFLQPRVQSLHFLKFSTKKRYFVADAHPIAINVDCVYLSCVQNRLILTKIKL